MWNFPNHISTQRSSFLLELSSFQWLYPTKSLYWYHSHKCRHHTSSLILQSPVSTTVSWSETLTENGCQNSINALKQVSKLIYYQNGAILLGLQLFSEHTTMLWMQIHKNQYITNRGNNKLNQSIEFKVQLLQKGLNGLFTATYNKTWVNALQTLIFSPVCLD